MTRLFRCNINVDCTLEMIAKFQLITNNAAILFCLNFVHFFICYSTIPRDATFFAWITTYDFFLLVW